MNAPKAFYQNPDKRIQVSSEEKMSEYWYALHVKPRFEKLVTTQLEEKGYETLLPAYESRRKWSDRVKTLSLPLFPGYTFCRFNMNARLPIVVTPGVTAILGVGRNPMPVDDSEIEAIRRVMISGAQAEPWAFINVGTRVRVESGALEGLEGIVLRVKDRERLIVSVTLLMRSVAVEIDRNSLQPVKPLRVAKIVTHQQKIHPGPIHLSPTGAGSPGR
jgi:transcription antitermination factor NusG